MKNATATLIAIVIATLAIAHVSTWFIARINFDKECGGYLKLAADASTIELAKERLGKAVAYLEKHELTTGNTSLLIDTPTNDIGEWYKNLKNSHDNLTSLTGLDLSETDKTNTLIKLRETIIDHNSEGDIITTPAYIQYYPYQFVMYVGWAIDILVLFVLGLYVKIKCE